MQVVLNLARLYVMTLKTMCWYTSRWHTIIAYIGRHIQVVPFHVQEMSSSIHGFIEKINEAVISGDCRLEFIYYVTAHDFIIIFYNLTNFNWWIWKLISSPNTSPI